MAKTTTALDTAANGKDGSIELARALLERKDTDVNAIAVTPDGMQVSPLYAATAAVQEAQWERVGECLGLARTLLAREDVDVNVGSIMPDGTKHSAISVALKTHTRYLSCVEACKGQGSTCECGPAAGAELVSLLAARGAEADAEDKEHVKAADAWHNNVKKAPKARPAPLEPAKPTAEPARLIPRFRRAG